VQLWEDLPELAAELPAKLEEMREYVRGIGAQPDARDDSIIETLVYAGEPAGLEVLLRLIREGNRFGRFRYIASDYIQSADDGRLSGDDAAVRSSIGSSTAADYRFDRTTRVWTRNPKQP
jgi:hypothetical protein